jgi:predicted phage-related endonuclease
MRLGFEIVYRQEDLIENMVAKVEQFCEAIDAEQLPTDEPLTAPQVSLLHPEAAGEVELDGSGVALLEEWAAIKHAIKDLEDQEKEIKDALANALLDKEFGTVCGQRVLSFKAQTTKRFDSKKLIADHPELENKYTTTSTFRVMRNVR